MVYTYLPVTVLSFSLLLAPQAALSTKFTKGLSPKNPQEEKLIEFQDEILFRKPGRRMGHRDRGVESGPKGVLETKCQRRALSDEVLKTFLGLVFGVASSSASVLSLFLLGCDPQQEHRSLAALLPSPLSAPALCLPFASPRFSARGRQHGVPFLDSKCEFFVHSFGFMCVSRCFRVYHELGIGEGLLLRCLCEEIGCVVLG